MKIPSLTTPLDDAAVAPLRAGDRILVQGTIYTARDRAHQRLAEMARRGETIPFDAKGAVIYYAGPSPAPPGKIVGAAGPTTSSRMDPFTGAMLELGVKGFIGKGKRSTEVRALLARHRAVYFATYGGAAAYLSARIVAAELVAFPDLGPEAVYRYEVKDFPVIVANDIINGDIYELALRK
jgi:fumarate hydratase subunit beta